MQATTGHPIVDAALALALKHPNATTLAVLDQAMEPYRDTHPDFEASWGSPWCDWLEPPSPFAIMLHCAFGMHLAEEDVHGESERWQIDVIEAFGKRYRLWQ